jgi:hypothetical protein
MIEVNGLTLDKQVVDKTVMSDVKSMVYDPMDKVLTIHQRDLCCTDMNGAIRIAKQIDHGVKKIVTYSGQKSDINYFLDEETNSWKYIDTRWVHRGGASAQ